MFVLLCCDTIVSFAFERCKCSCLVSCFDFGFMILRKGLLIFAKGKIIFILSGSKMHAVYPESARRCKVR